MRMLRLEVRLEPRYGYRLKMLWKSKDVKSKKKVVVRGSKNEVEGDKRKRRRRKKQGQSRRNK